MRSINLLSAAIALCLALTFIQPNTSLAADKRIVSAVDAKALPKAKQTRLGLYVTAVESADILEAHSDILLLDVRTRAEVMFVGMPPLAVKNIPFVELGSYAFDKKKSTYRLDPNAAFGDEVARLLATKGLSKSASLIVMCRSGTRSSKAANELAKLGYANVYSMIDGFEGDRDKNGRRTLNGWKNAGLPWTTKLDCRRLYREPM